MTRRVLLPVLLCSAVSVSVPMGTARAEEQNAQAEGRSHFRRGVDFFKEGDFRAALVEFKRAYEIAPNYKLLYNLAQTSLELQDYASALRSFERYLSDGGRDVAATRRAQVEAEIEKLRRRVARIEVTTNVSDAEVFVDDVSVGRTPLPGPLAVSAGRRKISALKGGLTAMRVVEVVGGDSTVVSLEIVEPSASVPVASARPSEASRPSGGLQSSLVPSPVRAAPEAPSRNARLWIGITVTGALAAGTVATGILALSAKKDFDNAVGRYGVDPQTVSDERSKTRALALVTDLLGGATIVVGGVTILASVGGKSSKERTRALRVNVTPGSLVATGTF
jgi:Tetratricopeptide repeat